MANCLHTTVGISWVWSPLQVLSLSSPMALSLSSLSWRLINPALAVFLLVLLCPNTHTACFQSPPRLIEGAHTWTRGPSQTGCKLSAGYFSGPMVDSRNELFFVYLTLTALLLLLSVFLLPLEVMTL